MTFLLKIVFEGTRGTTDKSDIAIDDVSLHSGACPPPGACDFERENSCTWVNAGGDDFDWIVQSGATTSTGTGPQADHTTGAAKGM